MHIPTDEEIVRFFDSISPEDFQAPTIPANEIEPELYPRHGKEEFERFELTNLKRLSETEESFAALNTGTENRVYLPREDEGLGQFLVRIAMDARRYGAKWLFVASPGQASIGDKTFDPNDPASVERAKRDGHTIDVINWYAESVEESHRASTHGVLLHNESDEQVIVRSSVPQGADPAFKRVLHTQG